ncbi:hypothetical protein CDD83_1814 [Cordyceps sp. RAO-2017]|nr:hypothetical protein CDD83_1814 [Cordyceps sp. RAO-2017]
MAASKTFDNLHLSIIGLGTQYPAQSLGSDAIDILSRKHYPSSPTLDKVLSINRTTGIDARPSVWAADDALVSQQRTPSISELHQTFLRDGVPLAVAAADKAVREAMIDISQITHIVSVTCTDSANPGFDHFVAKGLGITHPVEKVLLHGVGCSGGLAALRTGANLALGCTALGRPARVLCLSLEITSVLVRSELDSINDGQEVRIGVCLFSDCASALVLSNGIGSPQSRAVYDILGWDHSVVPGTEDDLGFDVDPSGWKVILTPRVPRLTKSVVSPTFERLKASLRQLPPGLELAGDFDWAMHPGGATVLSGAEEALGISPEHMRASYDVYIRHGNSSSATIFSVLDRLRSREMDKLAPDGGRRQHIVGCAFGPGVTVEMCMLRRNLGPEDGGAAGLETPPATASDDVADAALEPGRDDADKRPAVIVEALEQLELAG